MTRLMELNRHLGRSMEMDRDKMDEVIRLERVYELDGEVGVLEELISEYERRGEKEKIKELIEGEKGNRFIHALYERDGMLSWGEEKVLELSLPRYAKLHLSVSRARILGYYYKGYLIPTTRLNTHDYRVCYEILKFYVEKYIEDKDLRVHLMSLTQEIRGEVYRRVEEERYGVVDKVFELGSQLSSYLHIASQWNTLKFYERVGDEITLYELGKILLNLYFPLGA